MATTNILVETFPGISAKRTIAFSLPSTSTTTDLLDRLSTYLPENLPAKARLIVTTTSNKQILHSPTTTLSDLTHHGPSPSPAILPLRLSLPLCGGKGGFGSQLRAAGGRMSSRKKRNQEPQNSSNRNLDGRRLRTVAEAKSLATYLATKPEMDRKEKEERRRRWESVVEMVEVREREIRSGKGGQGRGKGVSDEWVADKEEVAEGVKSAVQKAMLMQSQVGKGKGKEKEKDGETGESSGSAGSEGGSEDDSDEDVMELDEEEMERLKAEADAGDVDAIFVLKNQVVRKPPTKPKRFAGFDSDDDEFLSSSDDEGEEESDGKGKGKQKI